MDFAIGPEPSPEEALISHLRASLFIGVKKQALHAGGPEAWRELVESLSPAAREVFSRSLRIFEWVEAPQANELMERFTARFPEGDAAGRIRATADEQLTVLHSWMLKLLSPETLIYQTPTIFKFNFRGGVVRLEHLEPGHGVISVWATGMFPGFFDHSLRFWLIRALELTGGTDIHISHEPQVTGWRHRYDLKWS